MNTLVLNQTMLPGSVSRSFRNKWFLTVLFFTLNSNIFGQNTIIYFKSDQYTLDQKATSALNALSDSIKLHPGGKLIISGHTDSDANEKYNEALSQKRVDAVIHYLQLKEKKLPVITQSALGELQPISSNLTEKEKALNRRVEISFIYPETTITEVRQESKKGNIKDLYALLLPEFEKHCIDNSKDTFLVCAKGTIIHIPKDAFHRTPRGCVNISIREALTKSDILLQNLSTKGTDGILISGGMLEIHANDDDGELHLKAEEKIAVLFPTDNVLENAGTYYGNRDTTHQQNMNWSSTNGTYNMGTTLPFGYWVQCWNNIYQNSTCDRCRFFCRLGRIDQGIKGIGDKYTHTTNKDFRHCQRQLRRNPNTPKTQNNEYCTSVSLGLQKLGITPDSVLFMKMYGKFMAENNLKSISETIEAMRKIELEYQKVALEQLKEMRRKDSIRVAGYNAIGIGGFGFINCDYFPGREKKDLINISTNLSYSPEVDCKLIFTEIRSVMYSYSDVDKTFCFNNVPKGQKVWLMALRYDGEQAYLFLKQMTIGGLIPPIVFEPVSLNELKQRIQIVN